MARLLLESGGERREIKLAGPVTVGRVKSCAVYLDDKTLSREHTRFTPEGGRYVVRDLNSKNGTFVNGARLNAAHVLRHGDRIRIGVATFVVIMEPGDAAPAAPAAPATAPTRPAAAAGGGSTVTAPTQPAAPRARSRRAEAQVAEAIGPFVGCIYKIIFLGVVVVGAYVFKHVFVWVFGMMGS